MTQFNEGKVYEGIRTIKSLSLKIQETISKSVVIIEKKGKQYVRQIICINQVHLPTRFSVQMNQSFSVMFQL